VDYKHKIAELALQYTLRAAPRSPEWRDGLLLRLVLQTETTIAKARAYITDDLGEPEHVIERVLQLLDELIEQAGT
jgi:hypothetical protein